MAILLAAAVLAAPLQVSANRNPSIDHLVQASCHAVNSDGLIR